jgi:two-component system, OmpR family, phosphate regulon sensor histidine kinase PhoR
LLVGLLGGLGAAAVLSTLVWLADGHRIGKIARWLSRNATPPSPQVRGPLRELVWRTARVVEERDQRIRQEQQRLAQFLQAIEASPNGVLLLDEEQQIDWFNARAADHFGLDSARDRRQRITNLMRAPEFVHLMQQVPEEHEATFMDPRSETILQVSVMPFGDNMLLVMSQDVTERTRNETMRREFVANASHEIRSPLTVLAGFLESLMQLKLDANEQQRVLALMQQQTQRMQALVTDLLSLAKLEGGPRPPTDQWIDAPALMAKLEAAARAGDGQRHRLGFECVGVAALSGSETELHSAFWNLLANALRYTPDGGTVHAALRAAGDGSAVFAVRDDGPGIEKEHIPRLTERFYRVDGARSRATGGTGLGLSIVKHVVQRHGGQLQIHSEVGKGSEFRITLPGHRTRQGGVVSSIAAPTFHATRNAA